MGTEPRRVEVKTLGCRLNQAESDELTIALADRGAVPGGRPDVVVINTCAVTSEAAAASRKLIRRTVREAPDAEVVVTGCYAVAEPEAVAAIDGVDLVISEKEQIPARVADRLVGPPTEPRFHTPRFDLKVQTGCDESCTFCIVPTTRGGLSSRSIPEVVEFARRLVGMGGRELVLTGVHLGKYGYDRGRPGELLDLIAALTELPELERIRLSSIEASQVTDELLALMAAEPKLCRHLHLPLQTGDRHVWEKMRRPGTIDGFLRVAERARARIPELTITTDVMVGFPGEDEEAFLNTLAVIERVGFEKLHVFRYSPRPGTPARVMPDRSHPDVLKDRSRRLRAAGARIRRRWLDGFVGRTVEVLIEQVNRTVGGSPALSGLTDTYLRVRTTGPPALVGRTVPVLVGSVTEESVEGVIVERLPVLQDR